MGLFDKQKNQLNKLLDETKSIKNDFDQFVDNAKNTKDELISKFKDELEKNNINCDPNLKKEKKLEKMIIQNPGITLKKDEVCFYVGKAKSYLTKEKTVGYNRFSTGGSVRIAKGLSVRSGISTSTPRKGTVVEQYEAKFYLTNYRMILLSEKNGFEIKLLDILQIEVKSDGIIIYTSNKNHKFLTNDIKKITSTIQLMNDVYGERLGQINGTINTTEKNENNNSQDVYEEIKKLKELLDLEIITNEEFEKKKKQLLDL